MSKNADLITARERKRDEFYTTLDDISKEMAYYKEQFKDKIVLMNCNNPTMSAFWEYFHINFTELGLRKLIATYYDANNVTYKTEYVGGNDSDIEIGTKLPLKGNGDFRSSECVEVLKESDIVVTNPPFSLFREYIALLMEYNNKFLIIGNMNAITYKDVFPLLRDNKVWLGASIHSGDRKFYVPNDYSLNAFSCGTDSDGRKFIRVKGVRWFTNMDYKARYTDLETTYLYSKKDTLYPNLYPKYDNYDAINVDKVNQIPMDYYGAIGVPITFMDKYNPEQFELVSFRKGNDGKDLVYTIDGKKVYPYNRILIHRKNKDTV